jgi:hypothetical protein
MIGRDEIDDPIAKPLPQRFPIGSRADRRRAFEERSSGRNLLGDEVQVVRTGLYGNGKALGASFGEILERQGSGQMNNVQSKSGFAAKPD